MNELFIKLEKLENISGKNDKKKFIKNNQDDKLFLDTLEFLLNPYKITNISKKKINKKVQIINNQLKDLTRGKKVTKEIIHDYIKELNISREDKERLLNLTPLNYIGLANKI